MSVGGTPGGGVRPGRRDWRRTVLTVLGVVAVAVWALVFLGKQRQVQHDPKFCASSCHHDAKGGASPDFHSEGHANVACQDCHTTSLATGLRLAWDSFRKAGKPVAHGAVQAQDCIGCHEKHPAEWRLIAQTAGHREHTGVKKVDCLSCHSSSTHAPIDRPEAVCLSATRMSGCTSRPPCSGAETCMSCHSYAVSAKNVGLPTTVACAKCHDSTADLEASAGGAAVRPMKEVNAHALHSGVACQLCHNAHGIKLKPPEGQPSCAKCHQFENFQVGNEQRTGPPEHRKCEGCHKPHLPRERHPRLRRLPREERQGPARPTGRGADHGAQAQGLRQLPRAAHVEGRAQRLHECHKAETELFQTRSPPQHTACTDCHDVHGPPPTGPCA